MKILVFDSESDGLAYEATKIHVMSWTWDGVNYQSTNNYETMKAVLNEADLLVCHNAIRHDLALFNRLLETTLQYTQFADSLALSWYFYPKRQRHGLEAHGNDLGVSKPKVTDWTNLSYEEYAHRCEEDVKINWLLWENLRGKLDELYGENNWGRFVEYLSFKMDCAREQEEVRWKLDVPTAEKHYLNLCRLSDEKSSALSKAMPPVPNVRVMNKPKRMYKQDGTLTALGVKWMTRLRKDKLPPDYSEPIEIIESWSDGNPASTPQIKAWLDSLGWKPRTFKYAKEPDGGERKIPQVRYPPNHPEAGHLCDSVLELKGKDHRISLLEGLTVINHRKAFFKALLDAEEGGYIKAEIDGLTNTLRFKHKKPLANIPGVDKPWGKEIRGVLTVPDDSYALCGADMSSLESVTKRHYMHPYDPDYVEEMGKDDFDEHLDLAQKAGAISKTQLAYYFQASEGDKEWERIHKIRKKFKPVNYGSVYGIGAFKLSREMGIPKAEAQEMIDAYWDRNWAVRKLSEDQFVKKTKDGEMWLQNPVSRFFYNLRFEKDRFSTLNQGTGVYCFDTWLKELRNMGVKTCGQFHDEFIATVKKEDIQKTEKIYAEALDKCNKRLKLNVPLGMKAQFGKTYAEIH